MSLTRHVPSFRLLEVGPVPARFAAIPLLMFSAPYIIMRNTIRGRRIEGRRAEIVMLATVIAGLWSLMSGTVRGARTSSAARRLIFVNPPSFRSFPRMREVPSSASLGPRFRGDDRGRCHDLRTRRQPAGTCRNRNRYWIAPTATLIGKVRLQSATPASGSAQCCAATTNGSSLANARKFQDNATLHTSRAKSSICKRPAVSMSITS